MPQNAHSGIFTQLLRSDKPDAMAWIQGNDQNRILRGIVRFYALPAGGAVVEAEVNGLPVQKGGDGFFAFHIHEKGDCGNNFADTGAHYNPSGSPHPRHAGDMIPLMSANGYAWMAFYDPRINVRDIIGRSVIIHARPDDFTTQPSGNSGDKIGCGVIRAVRRG